MSNKYPYTNFHELNLDWVIDEMKNIKNKTDEIDEAVNNANASAESASASAENASASAENASASAKNASASAESAATTVANTLNQINVLQARVDNIIPDGTQTAGNTELLDIRVGVNGKIYSSAGNAVRGQVSNLSDEINAIKQRIVYPGDNMLLDKLTATKTVSGVTITNNGNGTLTLNGTATSTIATSILSSSVNLITDETYVFCDNNDQKIIPSIDRFRLDIRKAATTGVVEKYEQFLDGAAFTASTTADYLINIRIQSGYTLNNLIIEPTLYNTKDMMGAPNRIRVCALNVGNFAMGKSGTAAGTDDIYNALINTFKNANADIYMFSEWDNYWNYSEETLSNDILGYLKPFHSNYSYQSASPSSYITQMNYSDFNFYDENTAFYGDGESRYYIDNVVLIGNKPVHIISTHLPFSSQTLRTTDINKLFEYINNNNIKYYIIGGDFNLGLGNGEFTQTNVLDVAREDINLIQGYNCLSVQGGFYGLKNYDGFMNTSMEATAAIPIQPYDNIVVSNNIRVRNVSTITCEGSDHMAIVADLEIN